MNERKMARDFIVVCYTLIRAGLFVGLVCVAVHFIAKFW
jgi:hypothetical protein